MRSTNWDRVDTGILRSTSSQPGIALLDRGSRLSDVYFVMAYEAQSIDDDEAARLWLGHREALDQERAHIGSTGRTTTV